MGAGWLSSARGENKFAAIDLDRERRVANFVQIISLLNGRTVSPSRRRISRYPSCPPSCPKMINFLSNGGHGHAESPTCRALILRWDSGAI
jgi:hypothetical protein